MSMTAAIRASKRTPFLQVAKSAIAAVATWLLATWLVPGPLPVFGAIAALLVVQPSLNQSFGKAVERSVGVVTGVLVASALGILLGNGTAVILAAIVAALILAWLLRMTPGAANQVAVSALLVLALGTATPNYALNRVLETLLGAAIGFLVNVLIVPPLSIAPAHRAVDELSDALAQGLDRLADALTTTQTAAQLDDLLHRARGIRSVRDAAEAAIQNATESLMLNPRAGRHRAELDALRAAVDRFSPIVTQLGGMTRALQERYEPALDSEPTVRAIADQLHRAAHDVRRSAQRVGSPEALVREPEPPALTTPLSVVAPSSDHWILVGSMLIDLLRIHNALAEVD